MPRGIPNARPDQGPGIVDPEQPVDEISGDDPLFDHLGAKLGQRFNSINPVEVPDEISAPADTSKIPQMIAGRAKWSRAKAVDFLKSEPFLPVYIPLTNDETGRGGTFYELVGWNGWHYPVPKGKHVFVPRPIAEIVAASQGFYHTVQAAEARAVDTMLVTAERPEGLLLSDRSDPGYLEAARYAGQPVYQGHARP
jgi:hypothetical protein